MLPPQTKKDNTRVLPVTLSLGLADRKPAKPSAQHAKTTILCVPRSVTSESTDGCMHHKTHKKYNNRARTENMRTSTEYTLALCSCRATKSSNCASKSQLSIWHPSLLNPAVPRPLKLKKTKNRVHACIIHKTAPPFGMQHGHGYAMFYCTISAYHHIVSSGSTARLKKKALATATCLVSLTRLKHHR